MRTIGRWVGAIGGALALSTESEAAPKSPRSVLIVGIELA